MDKSSVYVTNSIHSTGYGPSRNRIYFNGDIENFQSWKIKFLSYLCLQKLSYIVGSDTDEVDPEKKRHRFRSDKSLSLIIRNARNGGRLAMKILRDHYVEDSKPKIIALYTE